MNGSLFSTDFWLALWHWLQRGAIYFLIVAALGAGLAAAYGRELEAQRRPDRRWWLNRLLVMPVLAITTTAATEAFGLSASLSAFTAAMLSLGGYDALRLVERRWRLKEPLAVIPPDSDTEAQ